MRKTYIDNLRWICVLLLFFFHIFMIYNSYGENFYIKGVNIKATTTFLMVTWPWFMPLLFTVAGISTAYALQKRSVGMYMKERVTKLFVPLIAGILLLIPAQTYFAERFHNGYTGRYFAQYITFFTKDTDLTGYTGGFTPGHLWFILYLFVISLFSIPFILVLRKLKFRYDAGKLSASFLLCLFILPLSGALVLNISGKSFGEYFAYFMLGYILLSNEEVQQKLEKRRLPLLIIGLIGIAAIVLIWYGILHIPGPAYDIFLRFYGWSMILALLGVGRKYLNIKNSFTDYMSRASFSVYLFHQTWIVVSAYYVFQLTHNAYIQMVIILLSSVLLTFASHEICRRIKITRFLFAIKK